jgi:dTDP-4-amino-4,6-dideoxygalactose transaminase
MTTSPKRAARDFALLGGPPTFTTPLHVGRPALVNRRAFLSRVEAILDGHWYTNDGPLVRELEERIAALLGVPHCVAVTNGTVGLEITARSLGLSGEVIVPSFTFIATPHALHWHGLTPVFADISRHSHNLDPAAVERRITRRTSAILAVHLWGRPCAVESLQEIASRHGLALIFDAAHAFAASYQGRMVGGFGAAEVFSFHATKFFNTIEGGAIVTADDNLARRLRLARNFGFAGYDRVVGPGINAKMSEMSAAMGLTLLDELPAMIETNRTIYHLYRQELAGLPGIRLAEYDERERANYQYVVLEVEECEAGLSRDALQRLLWAENVRARRYFYPGCHRQEPYCQLGLTLPESERLAERVLVLPAAAAVSLADVRAIVGLIQSALAFAPQLSPEDAPLR